LIFRKQILSHEKSEKKRNLLGVVMSAAEQPHSAHTLWVSGLPGQATIPELKALFEEAGSGPVRRSFFAGRKGKKDAANVAESNEKKTAFVNLAESDNAAKVVENLNGKKVKVGGSLCKIAVKFARRRVRGERDPTAAKGESKGTGVAKKKRSRGKDASMIDALVAEARDRDEKIFNAKADEAEGTHTKFLDSEGDDESSSDDSDGADEPAATAAAPEKEVKESPAAPSPAPPAEGSEEELRARLLARPDQLRRVIIRNLSFRCTEESLRKACAAFGSVENVELPKKADGKKLRGFAFVRFGKIAEAQEAVSKLNGQKLLGRVVAVDRALPKDTFSAVQAKKPADSATEAKKSGDQDATMADAPPAASSAPARKTGPGSDATDRCTLFLQNLPHDVTRHDIITALLPFIRAARAAMRREGVVDPDEAPEKSVRPPPVTHVFMTKDSLTGVGRGSAFAKLATTALTAATLVQLTGEGHNPLVISGRTATAQLAVDRETLPGGPRYEGPDSLQSATGGVGVSGGTDQFSATQRILESDRQKRMAAKHVQDKRNLYLANEGLITPQDATSMGLSEGDVEKRTAARKDKKLKLATPNFSVSRTRLSVRNLPKMTDEATLRRVFSRQAKVGLLAGLADDVHLKVDPTDAGTAEKRLVEYVDGEEGPTRKVCGWIEIVQVKLLRDASAIDSSSQRAQSKGIAFVEFNEHHAALAALRAVNNNPQLFGGKHKRPIVEFAIEDARKVHLHQQRMEKSRSQASARGELSEWGKAQRVTDARASADDRESRLAESKRQQEALRVSLAAEAAREEAGNKTRKPDARNEKKREKRKRKEEKLDTLVAEGAVANDEARPARRTDKRRRLEEEKEFNAKVDDYAKRLHG
jgi:nucleolar protein 4